MAMFGAGINTYVSRQDGVASAAGTWSLVDPTSANDTTAITGGNTLNEGSGGVTSTTSYQKNTTFTYGTSPSFTVNGICIKVLSLGTITGTLTVAIDQANADVTNSVATINVSDLPANGWIRIALPGAVTLAASTYSVKFKTSVAGTVVLKNGSAGFAALLIETGVTGTPQNATSQNDNLYIMPLCSAAGTVTARTITWDITSGTFGFNSIHISGSTVNVENNASTNYFIPTNNDLRIFSGGVLNIGTSGTPIQSTSTCTLLLNGTQVTLLVMSGGSLNSYGVTKTTLQTNLTADAASSATSISVAAATNWAVGDLLGIATTSTTASQCEQRAITSVSGTTIGVAALTNAHKGTSPYIAEVINLSRNVIIKGKTNSTAQGYMIFLGGSTLVCRYTEFLNIGSNTAGNFSGFAINTTLSVGGIDMQYCSLHDWANNAVGVNIITANGSITFSNNVVYNVAGPHLQTLTTASITGAVSIDNNVFMLSTLSNFPLVIWGIAAAAANFTDNTMTGGVGSVAGSGIEFVGDGTYGTISGNTVHGCANEGVYFNTTSVTVALVHTSSSWTIWHCTMGIRFPVQLTAANIYITTVTAFSNVNSHIAFDSTFTGLVALTSLNLQAGTTTVCPRGIYLTHGATAFQTINLIYIDSSNIGDVTTHSTGDIVIDKSAQINGFMRNTKLGSTNSVNTQTNFVVNGSIGSDRHQQTSGNYATYLQYGTITRDTTIFGNASPSMRVTPNNLTNKVPSASLSVSVPDGASPTVSIRVRKSATGSGDSATYNGDQPQLILSANPQAGVASDTVLATCTNAANGAWETLSATLPTATGDSILSMYITCDGTAGWINVDDFATSQVTSNQGNLSFSRGGQPFAILGNGTNTVTLVPQTRKRPV